MFRDTSWVCLGDRLRPSGVRFAHFHQLPTLQHYCLRAWRLVPSLVLQFPTTKIALRISPSFGLEGARHTPSIDSKICGVYVPPRALLWCCAAFAFALIFLAHLRLEELCRARFISYACLGTTRRDPGLVFTCFLKDILCKVVLLTCMLLPVSHDVRDS